MLIVINPCKVNVLIPASRICDLLRQHKLTLAQESVPGLVRMHLEKLKANQALHVLSCLMRKDLVQYEKEEYEVEEILDHDSDEEEGTMYFLIKWRGWPLECATWEREDDLANCQELLREYKSIVGGGRRKRARPAAADSRERSKDKVLQLLDCIDFSGLSPGDFELTLAEALNRKALLSFENRRQSPTKLIRRRSRLSGRGGSSHKAQVAKLQRELQQWQLHLNAVCSDPARIVVENNVDTECPPWSFRYVNQRVAGPGVQIPSDPVIGCDCTDCYEQRHTCVQAHIHNEGRVPYTRAGKLRAACGSALHECNSLCRCGPDCPFRVVQNGRTAPLAIFRTKNRGWGVRTLRRIPRGTFVVEYVGEVVTGEEAERRGLEYDREGQTYLFDLDLDGDPAYSVDARDQGNISHFLNHSCSPNLAIRCVFTECIERQLPLLALFSVQSIPAGAELTFDYHMSGCVNSEHQHQHQHQQQQQQQQQQGGGGPAKIRCLCGSADCRGFLFD